MAATSHQSFDVLVPPQLRSGGDAAIPLHGGGDPALEPEFPITELGVQQTEVEQRNRVFRRLLAYADVVAALVALSLTLSTLGDDQLKPSLFLALPIIVLVGKIQGLYDRDELLIRKSTLDEAPQLFQLATLYTLVIWLLDGPLIEGGLGKEQAFALWMSLAATTFIARCLARRLATRATKGERVLFIGDVESFTRLREKTANRHDFELVGRMSLQRPGRRGDRNHGTRELTELIAWTHAHRVIIEPHTLPPEEMHDLVRAAKGVGVRVSLLPRVFDVVGNAVVYDELEGMTILGVRRFGLTRSSLMVKRAFDIAGSLLVLLMISPLLALIALAIKLDSRGPVFFRQTRIGRDGQPFRIFKFRTMVVDAEARKAELAERNQARGGLFKIEDDPRITRVGAILRRTSLDELPQLFNVLQGAMSLVGPRPLIADEDELVTGYDRHRLALTPGMTGPWQILDSARVPLGEMVKLDYLYVAGWSLWNDVKIMLRTIPYVLSRGGM